MSRQPEEGASSWALAPVSADAMLVWCAALRDDNPIHSDPAAAEALGFGPRTVNPGPTNLAYLMNMVMTARPEGEIGSVEAQLLGNVFAGDAVRAEGHWPRGDDAGHCEARLTGDPGARAVLTARIVTREKA